MENIEWIEKYLNRQLSEEEEAMLEQRLQEDEAFAEEFEVAVALNASFNVEQKAYWKSLREEVNTQPVNKMRSLGVRLLSVAAVLLALAVAAYLVLRPGGIDSDVNGYLAQRHMAPGGVVRGQNEESIKSWENIRVAYEAENFEAVAEILNSMIDTVTVNKEKYNFYLGLAELYSGASAKALPPLQAVAKADNPYQEEAQWFLSLALIKEGKRALALQQLEKIIQNNQWKANQAKQLSEKLR